MSDYYLLAALDEKGASSNGKWTGIDEHWIDDTTKEAVKSLREAGLVEKNTKTNSYDLYRLTKLGREYMEAEGRPVKLAEVGSGGNSEAHKALWAWLMVNGGHPDYYGGIKRGEAKFLHLCACGLDLDKTSPVQHETWRSFTGTFAEDDQDSGIGGRATCRCGAVDHYQVITKHFTLAQVLDGVLSL